MKKLLFILLFLPIISLAQTSYTISSGSYHHTPENISINVGDQETWINSVGLYTNIECIDSSLINPFCICPMIYAPVCACNGLVYSNSCLAQCDGNTIVGPVDPTLIPGQPCSLFSCNIFNTVTVSSCNDFFWDGITYQNTGLYTNVYTAANGCDSTVTLDLTINNSSTNTVTITSCDSYAWDGVTYTTTGLYTNIYTANNGCDSTVTLDLSFGINGCTDILALNYDSSAVCDDGSCTYSTNCTSPKPTGLYSFDVIDTRAKIGWDNMNDPDCMALKYFVRYREVGTNQWTTKSAGVGNGLCNFGLNTVTKQLLNLSQSTTYEFKMKAFYCGGTSSNYSTPVQFTTADPCPDMTNLTATTFNGNQAKVRFNWDTTGAYTFARILLRVDVPGSNWQTAGGFGVYYPTFFVNKFGLTAGENYRAQGRTFCDSNITAYRSPTWTSPIFWTQPNIRLSGGSLISNLDVYPNPSRDIFNISFNSDEVQDLTIRILNVIGAEVYREERKEFVGEYIKQISLDNYGKGIYFLEIETNSGIVNKKLILQ